MPNNAPIIFLLGTSTAGKTTICEEILSQDKNQKNLGLQVWGTDLECYQDAPRCKEYLKDNQKFNEVKKYFSDTLDEMDVFLPMFRGHFIGRSKVGNQTLHLLKEDGLTPLDNEEFEKNLTHFMQKTEERYNPEALRIIRELTQENPENFRKVAGFTGKELKARIFDTAIENSKNGKPTILDMVPGGKDEVEEFRKYLAEKNHICPTFVAVVHVPVKDLTQRMDERNKRAENENSGNARDGFFPFTQYAEIFGSNAKEPSQNLGNLSQVKVYRAIGKFGDKEIENEFGDKVRIKFRNMKGVADENSEVEHKSKMRGTFDILSAGKEFLTDKLGFEDGQNSIALGVKVKADAVYEHSQGSTAQIAGEIYGWAKEKMAENQVQAEEKAGDFAKKHRSCKSEESFSDVVLNNKADGKEGGEKGGR